MKAALSGRETALPDWSRPAAPSPSNSSSAPRNRTYSETNNSQSMPQHTMSLSARDYESAEDDGTGYSSRHSSDTGGAHLTELENGSGGGGGGGSQLLRQRRADYPASPAGHVMTGTLSGSRNRHPSRAASSGSNILEESPYRPHSNSRSNSFHTLSNLHWILLHKLRYSLSNIRAWNIGHFLQVTVGLLVMFLLYDSHHKANLIAERLKDFKSEEAMVFLHLHRIEQQSIQLHESLQDFDPSLLQQQNSDGKYSSGRNSPHIDSALIQKQTQQLLQMEEELSHEVRTLQTRIQHSAVRSIVHEFGEGPVQVTLEVEVDNELSKISVLLWHDTPHAAWTWLEQISQRLWDGAVVHLENNRVLNVASTREETAGTKLDFVERSQQRHEAWTVGLVESSALEGSGKGVGGLELFINLQDNTEFSKHDVCVGKVFDGFDVLHKIVKQSRELQQAGGKAITIRTARASHLTNRETKGLI